MSPPPALQLRTLTKRYDSGLLALDRFDLDDPGRQLLRAARAQRRGQDDADQRGLQPHPRHRRRDPRLRPGPHDAGRAAAGRPGRAGRQPRPLPRRRGDAALPRRLLRDGRARRARRRAGEMMDVFDLRAKAHVRAPKLCGGMRRRLLLARALMHEPRLVILDEPTAGVDFELRLELWGYIRRLHEGGTTILLTTHYLEEAEELCEEIALIRGGRLLARDSADGPARGLRGATRSPTSTSRRWRRDRDARRAPPGPARADRPRDRARPQAVDADDRRAGRLVVPLHRSSSGCRSAGASARSTASTTRSSSSRASSRWRWSRRRTRTTPRRSSRRASTATSTTSSPRPCARGRSTSALSLGGVVRALLIGGGLLAARRCRSSTCRCASRSCCWSRWRWRSLLFASLGVVVGIYAEELGPHRLRQQPRDPAADVPRRRLLLGRPPALAVGGDLAPQPDLLPDPGGALRLPRHERRQRRALAGRVGALAAAVVAWSTWLFRPGASSSPERSRGPPGARRSSSCSAA